MLELLKDFSKLNFRIFDRIQIILIQTIEDFEFYQKEFAKNSKSLLGQEISIPDF